MKSKYWKGAAAEKIGPLHIRQNLPMQDANRLCFYKSGFIAVVSDGLGSKAHSDYGSQAACRAFMRCSKKWIRRKSKSLEKLIGNFHKCWIKLIEKSDFKISDCGATLLGAVCDGKDIFLFRLGDGMIACLSGKKNFLLSDSKTESFSNVTNCLKNINCLENWSYLKVSAKNIRTIFMCTDGISDDLKNGNDMEFVQDLAGQYETYTSRQIEVDMNNWISNWPVPRHSDDKTAIFITREGSKNE